MKVDGNHPRHRSSIAMGYLCHIRAFVDAHTGGCAGRRAIGRDDPGTGDRRKRRRTSGRDGHAQKSRASGSVHDCGYRRAWRIPTDAITDRYIHGGVRVGRIPDLAVERDPSPSGIHGEAGPVAQDRRAGRDGDCFRADSAGGRHAGLHRDAARDRGTRASSLRYQRHRRRSWPRFPERRATSK